MGPHSIPKTALSVRHLEANLKNNYDPKLQIQNNPWKTSSRFDFLSISSWPNALTHIESWHAAIKMRQHSDREKATHTYHILFSEYTYSAMLASSRRVFITRLQIESPWFDSHLMPKFSTFSTHQNDENEHKCQRKDKTLCSQKRFQCQDSNWRPLDVFIIEIITVGRYLASCEPDDCS